MVPELAIDKKSSIKHPHFLLALWVKMPQNQLFVTIVARQSGNVHKKGINFNIFDFALTSN
jgi:hypothetical protein